MKIGDEVRVRALRDWSVTFKNDLGGTDHLPKGRTYRITLTHTFFDSETGGRCVGLLLDEKDIARARKKGTTDFEPKDKTWNPAIVYFARNDIEK